MTGYDGANPTGDWHNLLKLTILLDRLQFTITSRKEMPNSEFTQEIARAAEDIQSLFEGQHGKKSRL